MSVFRDCIFVFLAFGIVWIIGLLIEHILDI